MSTRLPGLIVLLLLFVNVCGLASSAPYWGTFSRAECIKPGFRKYYARLWDIDGEWGPACDTMPALVQNVYFPAPDRCVDKGIGGEWGEFFLREQSCDPWWHQINNYQCEKESFHKYSSWLEHIEGNWQDWCVQTSAVVRGIFFPTPTICYSWWGLHEWGDFKVPDICCGQRHVELKSTGATQPLKLYDSEDGYMGLCVAPRSFVHWLELIHDAVELWRERERQTCRWPIAGAVVAARRINSNSRTAINILDSECILKVFETWRQNAGHAARSDDEDECESDEEMPPFPIVSDRVTDMAGAVAEFGQGIIRTARLLPYLFRTAFYTIVSVTSATVSDFHATVMQRTVPGPGPEPVQEQYLCLRQNVLDPTLPNSLFQAMLVPTTPAHDILGSGGLFPVGSYATIHLRQPRPHTASAICTHRFTGCTLAIGWDRVNRVLYIGHVQPGAGDLTLHRASISNYMRMRGGFENVELDRERDIYFFGGDDMYYSYGTERANVIGFIYDTHVEMFFQVTTNDDVHIIKSWIIFYCADDEDT